MTLLNRLKFLSPKHNAKVEILHEAVDDGNYARVEQLLDRGLSPNLANRGEQTPLLGAVTKRHRRIVELLLSRGANVNAADNFGTTPLAMAARKGDLDLMRILVAKGANVDGESGLLGGPLAVATEAGSIEIVKFLLSKNAKVDACAEKDRRTALHAAAYKGHEALAALLLARGANFLAVDKYGKTAADYASERGNLEIVRMIKGQTPTSERP